MWTYIRVRADPIFRFQSDTRFFPYSFEYLCAARELERQDDKQQETYKPPDFKPNPPRK